MEIRQWKKSAQRGEANRIVMLAKSFARGSSAGRLTTSQLEQYTLPTNFLKQRYNFLASCRVAGQSPASAVFVTRIASRHHLQ
jgi:hypothetical protein